MLNHGKSASARHRQSGNDLSKAAVENPSKTLARRITKSLQQKEMIKRTTLGLYSLKTKDSPFGIPYCAVSDHYALLAQKQLLPVSDCYKVGTFCLYDGKVSNFNRPILVLDNKVE